MPDGAVREAPVLEEACSDMSGAGWATGAEGVEGELTWRVLGLETVASMLVVSLLRQGDRSFEAQCQWPRMHPLNERVNVVEHHPLIVVESTRQIAAAVQRGHLRTAGDQRFEAVSVRLGLHPGLQPSESGSATHVRVRVTLSDVVPRAGALASFRVTAEYLHARQVFATCTMVCARPVPDEGEPLVAAPGFGLLHPSAAAVGAVADADVLLARGPQGRLVVVPRDPAHPILLPGRPRLLTVLAVLEAGRQAVLLSSGMTSRAVAGLRVDIRSAVPARGATVAVVSDHLGAHFAMTVADRPVATGTVSLRRS
ncbi:MULTISPECIES: AfsA-related hotdog domain-containing protein [unclassified Streptomyces]|uniref:AfsA-related hotdog domain-containing protein n=1 Tax=unclassified Streptomyces TaxID=2593676 RepID=UPI002E2DB785|nr:AfsA-related hotdog domain-containing protein [Streptomyces sp. NBC_00228]